MTPIGGVGQQKDAATVMVEMREALGGADVLSKVKSISMSASGELKLKGTSMRLEGEVFLELPDKYVYEMQLTPRFGGGAAPRGAPKMVSGFNGPELLGDILRRGSRPLDAKEKDRALRRNRHDAARFAVALLGTTLRDYPMQFTYAGTERAGSDTYDVLETAAPGDVTLQLYVDAHTHLPAMFATTGMWETKVPIRWLLSDFKSHDGLNWPRRIEQESDGLIENLQVKRWKVNPKIDARKFDVK